MAHLGLTHLDAQRLPKILGQHTRLGVRFSWTLNNAIVDLSTYTVRVWVTLPSGDVLGPFSTTISSNEAEYVMSASDLADASLASGENVHIVAVAENGTHTLVSDAREISVGAWGGASEYTPVP